MSLPLSLSFIYLLTNLNLHLFIHSFVYCQQLTKKQRLVKVINMLNHSEDVIQTCQEEAISDILNRYLDYNKHAQSYTFKALKDDQIVPLDMTKTLEENGVLDETETFYELGINDDFYIPVLHIYYNDDLTVA